MPAPQTISEATAPLHERLSPDHKDLLHGKMLSMLSQMIYESERHIEQRFPRWDRVDEHLRIHVNMNRAARAGDWNSVDARTKENPWRRMILIPLSYSAIMSRMVIAYQVFTASDPFFHLEPVGGEDLKPARMHEAAMAYDARMSRNPLQVWQMLLDSERYGIAVWHDTWEEKYGWKVKPPHLNIDKSMVGMLPPEYQKLAEPSESWSLLKEWNNWRTIDPRTLLPDPTVPLTELQLGTRFGHWEIMNWMSLKEAAFVDGNGPYINIAKARSMGADLSARRQPNQRALTGQFGDNTTPEMAMYPNLKVAHVFCKLIPKDHGLSPKEYPEIWQFAVVDKKLIVRAHPLPYAHQQFPYAAGTADADMHSAFVPGMGEHLIGLQDVATWLINAHIVNARKIIHDRMIVNDELIRIDDFLSPDAGQQIRLTKEGKRLHKRGMDLNSMYGQLMVSDITKGHIDTVQMLLSWAQRASATPDPVQSMPLPTKRTLGEVQQVTGMGTARIGTPAALLDEQIVKPVAERGIINRQQFTSMEQAYRLTGRLAEELGAPGMTIAPDDLYGQYDYVARTPTMPEDPSRQAALWGTLYELIATSPELMTPDPITGKAIDPHAIFEEFVKANGVNYIENFYRQIPQLSDLGGMDPAAMLAAAGGPMGGGGVGVGVVPDEELAMAAEAGNALPIPGAGLPGAVG